MKLRHVQITVMNVIIVLIFYSIKFCKFSHVLYFALVSNFAKIVKFSTHEIK